MVQPIGIIRLAPGEVGYYDPYTKIHLTLSRKEATVYNYMNTSRLITAVADRILILKAGTLYINNEILRTDNKSVEPQSFAAKQETTPVTEAVVETNVEKQIPVEEKKAATKKVTKTTSVETKSEEVELKTGDEKADKK